VVLRESECSAEVLYNQAKELLEDRERLFDMGRAVQAMAVPDSAERICRILLDLAKN
jgi:UDP-N-acetylglucosamine:LPS N-acetylglucosamine transferase